MLVSEELLLRTKRIIDPFNRMGCNIEPTLTVIEFCQFQGPRALTTVSLKPSKVLSSVDIDNLSLWLMSSEVTSGTILNIYNQQMGIYAFSYYTVIYDIRARAFQRPICIAFLTSKRLTHSQLSRFSNGVRRLVSPLIKCNRRLFLRQLADFMKISDAVGKSLDLAAVKEVFVAFVKTSVLSPISNLAPCVSSLLFLIKNLFRYKYLLCPVLTGEDMVVCGSEQRKGTVVDFVEKINLLKPKSHPNHEVVLWTKNKDRPKGIIGVCRNRNESAALDLPGVTILDINASLLRTNPYRGVLLANLKQKRRFPSDATLLSFIAAALTNISSLVYMSRYLSPLNLETENISLDDQRILVNLLTELDFIKYQELKSALERMHPKDVLTKVIQL
uniref:UDENN FLCN/SMCR8-type domain-containing protein n=1 Tax=Angiostrongylus cantonensis TaxID=6313 RepID=A0A0K0DAP7_ANGCA